MVNNKISVYIDGVNMTHYVVQPFKCSELLDEQLDEAVISLRNCPVKSIPPLTPVEIRIVNEITMGSATVSSQTETIYMIVSGMSDSEEMPVGSGRYNHDLPVIECTKETERVICDSVTYTNDLGRVYPSGAKQVEPIEG